MLQSTTQDTRSLRIDSSLLERIRIISKSKGQTISGYISVILKKQIEKDWAKLYPKD